MSETWEKRETTEEQPLPETQYEVKDTVVVRSVTKSRLEAQVRDIDTQISNLEKQKEEAKADLAKIEELEAK